MISTADLVDDRGDRLQSCETQFRQFGGRRDFEGKVRTVRCQNDNALLKEILGTDGTGQVLVVDGGASMATALMGDLIADRAVQHGWEGVVINGPVRDSVALGGLDLGIKALGTNPAKSGKAGTGEADAPVSFGGVTFNPGAMLYSDADGIVLEG